ncbi:1-acyl-sn-glycerol-3-phosphate acyltransferase [Aliikangiella sp. IMCC44359]|uniref:1-acyl-sn-glycerol-3-phosphate acyltransferase n=1 Tax=Aliikangiella sp. IMCC44359 TaxID=3459125 RepID=UPI00403AAC8C
MFNDIRPFYDSEVVSVIDKLIKNKELQITIAKYLLPKLSLVLPSFSCFLIKFFLRIRLRKLSSIRELQKEVAKFARRMIANSTDGFTYSGLDKLDLKKPMLFISNHRDIALDPALVNIALFEEGTNTAEIAIGNNLMKKNWIADLMRLNKGFIVKRNETNKRAILAASKELSAYIHHTLTINKHHIWIAQREGRAKDGIDKTNAALISMLLLNKNKQQTTCDYIKQLNIVPVSIAYEFDPCDRSKAMELATIEETGNYLKDEHEDISSITTGILGYKGRVHIEFGQPIQEDYDNSKALAEAIDQQIIQNYRLFATNITAHAKLCGSSKSHRYSELFHQRIIDLSESQQRWLLNMYANPVFAKENKVELL